MKIPHFSVYRQHLVFLTNRKLLTVWIKKGLQNQLYTFNQQYPWSNGCNDRQQYRNGKKVLTKSTYEFAGRIDLVRIFVNCPWKLVLILGVINKLIVCSQSFLIDFFVHELINSSLFFLKRRIKKARKHMRQERYTTRYWYKNHHIAERFSLHQQIHYSLR